MAKKSASAKREDRAAGVTNPAPPGHLARLLAAMDGPVDTSEIPESKGKASPVRRDPAGRLVEGRKSPIRSAVLAELGRRKMTRYELWRKARGICETLPRSAVYEYLRGQREIGLPYAEAIMEAVGLVVSRPSRAGTKARAKARPG